MTRQETLRKMKTTSMVNRLLISLNEQTGFVPSNEVVAQLRVVANQVEYESLSAKELFPTKLSAD